MKSQSDRHRTERSFQIGDRVFLKLQSYRQTSITQRRVPKLGPKFFGPFKVLDKIGKVAYKLKLPEDGQIHNVVHVSQLKLAVGYFGIFIPLPTSVSNDRGYEPLAILDRKMVKKGNETEVQVLIHWKDLSPAEATWEFILEIKKRFPMFSLEDKGL